MKGGAFAGARSNHFVFAPVRGRNRAKSFELLPDRRAGISMGMTLSDSTSIIFTNEAALLSWLGAASAGDRAVYHRGYLAIDGAPTGSRLTERERMELLRITRRAMQAAEVGLVELVQHRNGPYDYSYQLIARHRSATVPGSILAALGGAEAR
jgi:hypothetical protein